MTRSLALCIALLVACAAAPSPADAELPREARLTIDGEAYNVPIGKAFAVRIGGERVTLRIDPLDEREFEESGVAFRYPASLELESNKTDEAVTIWTLQGTSAALMLQRYEGGLDEKSLLEVLVDNIAERDGVADDGRQAVKLRGAERSFTGTQLRSSSGDGPTRRETVQNVFTFTNAEGVFTLVVQDARPEGSKDSAEYVETLRLLGESLVTGPEPPTEADSE